MFNRIIILLVTFFAASIAFTGVSSADAPPVPCGPTAIVFDFCIPAGETVPEENPDGHQRPEEVIGRDVDCPDGSIGYIMDLGGSTTCDAHGAEPDANDPRLPQPVDAPAPAPSAEPAPVAPVPTPQSAPAVPSEKVVEGKVVDAPAPSVTKAPETVDGPVSAPELPETPQGMTDEAWAALFEMLWSGPFGWLIQLLF